MEAWGWQISPQAAPQGLHLQTLSPSSSLLLLAIVKLSFDEVMLSYSRTTQLCTALLLNLFVADGFRSLDRRDDGDLCFLWNNSRMWTSEAAGALQANGSSRYRE